MTNVNSTENTRSAPKSADDTTNTEESNYATTSDQDYAAKSEDAPESQASQNPYSDEAMREKYPDMTDEEIKEMGWKSTWPTAGKPEEWAEKLKKMAKASRESIY